MKLRVERRFLKPEYTIGRLDVDGKFFCDTLEDRVRDLSRERKIAGETAIPAGCYEDNRHPIHGRYPDTRPVCRKVEPLDRKSTRLNSSHRT